MGEPQLQLLISPEQFFGDRVAEAIANQNIDVGDEVKFYLVNLLCEFIAPNKIDTAAGEISPIDTPLAIMMQQAMEAPPAQRLRIFKLLGDSSLYVAGFFQDYFNRKTFDIGYYIDLGSSAYDNVSVLIRDQHADAHFTSMYRLLANQFQKLVDVVAEVAETGSDKPLDVLAVYDRWTRSHSERLLRILHKAGIMPVQISGRDRQ